MDRPPCWPKGQECPNSCAQAHYDRTVYNQTPLHGPWTGWRMAGRDLVTPDGVRLSPERLRGLAWRQEAEKRLAGSLQRKKRVRQGVVTVVRVDLQDWHRERFGTVAG